MNLNRIVKYLIYSDLIFYTGWGLISPIFAIFILQQISGGTALIVGIASAINLIVRSGLRVPFGMFSDKDGKKQKRAYWLMFFGLLIAALVPFGYAFSYLPWHIYIFQAILGASLAMSTAGWTCIFTRHMDKGKESTEWGIDAVAVGIGPGIAAAIGGFLATYFGFKSIFIIVGLFGLIGVIILLFVKKDVLLSEKKTGGMFHHLELRRLKKARIS